MNVEMSNLSRLLIVARTLLMCGISALQVACANELKPVVKPKRPSISEPISISEPNPIKTGPWAISVLVKNRFVNPETGAVIGEVKDVDQYHPAIPIEGMPHHFQVGNVIVNAKEQTVVEKVVRKIRMEDNTHVQSVKENC